MDYVIELSSFGVSLRFNPILQILTSIRFSKMDEVILQYPMGSSGQVTTFSMPKKVATVGDVYQTFGPTQPGKFESNFQHFVLEYPGLAFVFAVPSEKSMMYSQDASLVPQGSDPQDALTPNLSLPLVSLYCRTSEKAAQIVTREDALRELENRPSVQVQLGQSISFWYPSSSRTTTLMFGTHVQDVITFIGLPDARFTKPATAFSSSRASSNVGSAGGGMGGVGGAASLTSTVLPEPDYFFNYFDLGVDILFDGRLHVAKKFVLWTNLPSQPDFVRYSKCHYCIETRDSSSVMSTSSSSSNIRASSSVPHNIFDNDGAPNPNEDDEEEEQVGGAHGRGLNAQDAQLAPQQAEVAFNPLAASDLFVPPQITPQMKWPAIQEVMGPPTGSPYWFPSREGAFGGMTYYAYPSIIFEVMKKDDYVSKIFLFPK